MPKEPAPLPPLSAWPVQVFLPEHGFYWYVRPAAVVCQTIIDDATIPIVDAHNDMLDAVLAARRDEVRDAGGLFIFNDWRSIRSFAPGARSRMQERMKARQRGYARRTVVVVNPANRLLRMALEAASLFKTLTFSARVDVALSAEIALRQAELSAPPAGEKFPSRG
jgi:hypothetical protein